MVRLEHVYKIYSGSIYALKDVSLKIDKGEFVYLKGHSGAGKTTLFKLITAYDHCTSGFVEVAGYNYAKIKKSQIPFVRRRMGVVFQDFKLLKNRTVAENVALPLQICGTHSAEISGRVKEALNQVGLRYRGDDFPEFLSGGEQQRVAIARALIAKPGLLIADEPTGNLDGPLSEEIMELFERINAQGTTVFVATHNDGLIKKNGRRILCLEKGQLKTEASRSTSQIVELPMMELE